MNYKEVIKRRILKIWGGEPRSITDLAHCVMAVIERQPATRSGNRRCQIAGFSWDIRRSQEVSNSHDAPVSGVTNWDGRARLEDGTPAPRGYPGWTGRVWIRYAKPVDTFGNDPFTATLTYPGTGGWGSYSGPWERISTVRYRSYGNRRDGPETYPEPQIYSWDYRFFDSDWPDLYYGELFEIIKQAPAVTRDQFLWEDPAIRAADEEFIDQFSKRMKEKV